MSGIQARAEHLFGGRSLVRSSSTPKKKQKSYNVIMDEAGAKKVTRISSRVEPSTQTEAFRVAIQIADALIDEYDKGSVFYIKRPGDKEPVKIEIIG